MVKLLVGHKGSGKTKQMVDMANDCLDKVNGSVVFINKNQRLMYDLNYRIRVVCMEDYELITNTDEYIGFILGIISQDHDLQQMYFDGYLAMSKTPIDKFEEVVGRLEKYSEKFAVDFILSVSVSESELPESVKSKIIVSL